MGRARQAKAGWVVIQAGALRSFACEILRGLGARPSDAERVSDHLVSSNLAGHDSHGVLLLPYYADLIAEGQIRLDTSPEIVYDARTVVAIDGHFGFGQAIGRWASDLAVERARLHGVACVLGRNANHLGRIGEHTSVVAQAGLAAILLVNYQGSEQNVGPFGSSERRLTNNPISIAAPGGSDPVFLDMALSAVAEAKVWLAKARGQSLPEGWIADAAGCPSRDPDDFFSGGSLLPLGGATGGHKGYALIVLVDILAGLLSGGGICRADAPERFSNAFLMLVLDVAPLLPKERYDEELETLKAYIKGARRLPEVEEILFPGELEVRNARERASHGIAIEPSTWTALKKVAKEVGVEPPV